MIICLQCIEIHASPENRHFDGTIEVMNISKSDIKAIHVFTSQITTLQAQYKNKYLTF